MTKRKMVERIAWVAMMVLFVYLWRELEHELWCQSFGHWHFTCFYILGRATQVAYVLAGGIIGYSICEYRCECRNE